MSKFWLMNQHGDDGPTALVETDSRLQIIDVLRFGPSLTELDDQQEVRDKVMGRVAPTLKPFVKASSIDEKGIEPHAELQTGDRGDGGPVSRAGRRAAGRSKAGGGRVGGGPSRRGGRGER